MIKKFLKILGIKTEEDFQNKPSNIKKRLAKKHRKKNIKNEIIFEQLDTNMLYVQE